jgi:hypothetical protein
MRPGRPWLERPSLPYQVAFDICAVEAGCVAGPVAVLAGSPFYARELLKRMAGGGYLCPLGGWDPRRDEIRAALGPELAWERIEVLAPGAAPPAVAIGFWAEPQEGDPSHLREWMRTMLEPDGRLILLASNRLRSLLPEWGRSGRSPAQRPLGWGRAARLLRAWGWRVERVLGLPGPASMICGFLARPAGLVGREDWVDRLVAGSRRSFLVEGWFARWAPLAIGGAQRGA